MVIIMQQEWESVSKDEEKVTTAWFVGVAPINLGSDWVDEMKIETLGIANDGIINLGSDSSDEMKIIVDVVPKMRREPNIVWLQELEEIN